MRLGYLGPPGTFCEEALRRSAGDGPFERRPFATERAAIMAVQRGDADAAIVPIENALEGGVTGTLDTLALDADAVEIAGEVVLPVHHRLVAPPGVTLEAIEAVHSHPQALGQCARFLDEHLPDAQRVAATSTAEAVRAVAQGGAPRAAIGTALAAELYGCDVLREGVEDDPGNETRFVWVRRAGDAWRPPGGGADKTTVVFHGPGDTRPGWLVRCLSEFAFRGINLTRIESRPRKKRLGHYLFVVDLEGATGDVAVREAIDGLRSHCDDVRVLGSYRSG